MGILDNSDSSCGVNDFTLFIGLGKVFNGSNMVAKNGSGMASMNARQRPNGAQGTGDMYDTQCLTAADVSKPRDFVMSMATIKIRTRSSNKLY